MYLGHPNLFQKWSQLVEFLVQAWTYSSVLAQKEVLSGGPSGFESCLVQYFLLFLED